MAIDSVIRPLSCQVCLHGRSKRPNKDFLFVLRGDGMDTLPCVLSLMSAVPTLLFCFVYHQYLTLSVRNSNKKKATGDFSCDLDNLKIERYYQIVYHLFALFQNIGVLASSWGYGSTIYNKTTQILFILS